GAGAARGPGASDVIAILFLLGRAEGFFARQVFGPADRGGVSLAVAVVNGQPLVVVGSGPGIPDQIAVLDGRTGNVVVPATEVLIGDTGGVRVAAQAHGQVCQIYLGTGPGDPAVVEAIELDLSSRPSLRSLWVGTVFGGSTDGVTVAAGDVLGDGGTEVVVGSGPGETAKVTILKGSSGDVLLAPTTVFGAAYTGGLSVAAGDVNGDGTPDVVIGSGPGVPPKVAVVDGLTG